MSVLSIVLSVPGAALTIFAAWERWGRGRNARAWVRAPGERALLMALMLRPGLGLVLLSLGLITPLRDVPVLNAIVALLGPVGLVMLFWAILQLPLPRWWVPERGKARWDKEREERRLARAARKGRS